MSEGSRWLLSVALYALAVMLMAPNAYALAGLYFYAWGIPWPSHDWAMGQLVAAGLSWLAGFFSWTKARELNR